MSYEVSQVLEATRLRVPRALYGRVGGPTRFSLLLVDDVLTLDPSKVWLQAVGFARSACLRDAVTLRGLGCSLQIRGTQGVLREVR